MKAPVEEARELLGEAHPLLRDQESWSIIADVIHEADRAMEIHGAFHSAHEGHSVLREEFEELWDHVKADTGYTDAAYKEAMQVAATAIKYMVLVRERQARV